MHVLFLLEKDPHLLTVEEILERTDHETLMKIYNVPHINSTLEFLTMLALLSGRLLKVSALPCIFIATC